MASNKTKSVKKVAPKAKAPAKKAATKKVATAPKAPIKVGPRHPKGRVAERHGSKAALAKALAPSLARAEQDADALEVQLRTASNAQLLRLQKAAETLKAKFGTRAQLIEAIGTASKKAKDKDFLAKLDSYSLPRLLDLAASAQRAARS